MSSHDQQASPDGFDSTATTAILLEGPSPDQQVREENSSLLQGDTLAQELAHAIGNTPIFRTLAENVAQLSNSVSVLTDVLVQGQQAGTLSHAIQPRTDFPARLLATSDDNSSTDDVHNGTTTPISAAAAELPLLEDTLRNPPQKEPD